MSARVEPQVDAGNPWLGLASFTEETREFFYGREDEVAELARRVQRKLLTVLFGQSGLGKTSILRAGLVPRLRSQDYCPVYVRVDYSPEAPEPGEQVKEAIARSAREAGQWSRAGVAAAGESLWEFMHHRDDLLLDAAGRQLTPLIIFDQFEEIFTIAQGDDAGRARAARFIADLADLVENRPPAALERRLESDDSAAEQFDFARDDYRVLIALREDYLAQLESLKAAMPGITQNRLRLARMNGTQGLEAVLRPGRKLVSEEVAAAIVRFVAGGAELQNAEVEPSLLSLICRELNEARLAQGRSEISLDLLAGSHATILSNFYERSLADQPAAVRRIIEDELLTESGFRENIAEERLRRSFAAAGAPPEALSTLVNRRLLRIEERLDVRRVELTHDVLCRVVKGSRDIRHEREAREDTERLLAEQRQREAASRRALVRARQVAAVCIVLAVGAVAAALYGYLSTQRAKRAEGTARASREQAEQLVGYLSSEFARELESVGRLDIMASLAQREIDYFNAMPAALQTPFSRRTAAIAMNELARASRTLGNIEVASTAAAQAQRMLEELRSQGDTSAETAVALARALSTHARILSVSSDSETVTLAQRAVDLIAPLAAAPGATAATRESEVELLVQLGYQRARTDEDMAPAIAVLQRAMKLAAGMGAKDLSNRYMADRYIEAGAWIAQASTASGRSDLTRSVGADAGELADRILAQRPNDRGALYSQGIIQSNLAGLAVDEMRPQEAFAFAERSVDVQQRLLALDPGNTISSNNLGVAYSALVDASWVQGRLVEALAYQQKGLDITAGVMRGGVGLRVGRLRAFAGRGRLLAQLGRFDEITQLGQYISAQAVQIRVSEPKDSLAPVWVGGLRPWVDGNVALARGDAATALSLASLALEPVEAAAPPPGGDFPKWVSVYNLNYLRTSAALVLGDYATGERSARRALEARRKMSLGSNYDRAGEDELSTMLALALLGRQRRDEARAVLEPVVKRRREVQARNRGDYDIQSLLANALYVQAMLEPAHRAALLQEAAGLLDAAPPAFRQLAYVKVWRNRIRAAQVRSQAQPQP